MKRVGFYFAFFAAIVFLASCKKQESDSDGIRDGINQHLNSLKTLNLGAMDMNVLNFSVQGDQAQAQVEFRPKTGGAPGSGMQVNYSLAKQGGKWVVQNSQPAGGTISHPGPGENPPDNPTSPSSNSLPDFRNLVGSDSGSSLPTGHPPVNSQGSAPPQ